MTHIAITTRTQAVRFTLPLPKFPSLRLGEMFFGVAELLGRAFSMAYVEPFRSSSRHEDDRI